MREPPAESPVNIGRYQTIIVLIALYLIVSLAMNVLTPAHEYDSRTDVYLSIVLNLGTFGFMIWLKNRVASNLAPGDEESGLALFLFWAAVVAELGLLGIRFLHGEASWWTGHLNYTLRY